MQRPRPSTVWRYTFTVVATTLESQERVPWAHAGRTPSRTLDELHADALAVRDQPGSKQARCRSRGSNLLWSIRADALPSLPVSLSCADAGKSTWATTRSLYGSISGD